jgi:hypothetical protein
MSRFRWVLAGALLLGALAAVYLWWARPKPVDMATFAPANSMIYLESNSPLAVVEAVSQTDAWTAAAQVLGSPKNLQPSPWFRRFVTWTGIGPIHSVILFRAQVAVVVTDFGTTEKGDTLTVKPEGALIIETHTAESRIRGPVEENLKRLAEVTYGRSALRRSNIDGVEFIEWAAPDASRRIVSAIVGSLVIVGNSEQSVRNCLAVAQQRSPSLKDEPELRRMRTQLGGDSAVAFGYVPARSSSRLLSAAAPLIFGRTPDDPQSYRLVTGAASKVLGSVGWSSYPFKKGIEDRYSIMLQPAIVSRLKQVPGTQSGSQVQGLVPDGTYSVTYYRFTNPAQTWQDLKGVLSSQLDVLSAVLISSILNSALEPYGIDEPAKFLAITDGELVTLRLNQDSRSLLMARIRDRASLNELLSKRMGNSRKVNVGGGEIVESTQNDLAAGFIGDFVVMGPDQEVKRFFVSARTDATSNSETTKRMTFFAPLASQASIITYTNDGDRVRSFISALMRAKSGRPQPQGNIEELIGGLPYSATETILGDQGIERTTRSPLGQFSTLLPLLFPEPVDVKEGPQSP